MSDTIEKPTLQKVLEYAETQITYYLRELAREAKREHQEEMGQEARERVFKAYEKLEAEKGWKTFVQQHVFGAIQDYQRRGKGFEETKWSLSEERDGETAIRFREDGPSDTDIDIDRLIGMHRHTNQPIEKPDDDLDIKWDLLARLASKDHDLHIFVRHYLKGQTLTALTAVFGVTRERIGQRLQEFVKQFDDPKHVGNPWVNQTIYALGISRHFKQPETDQGCGWNLEPISFELPDVALEVDEETGEQQLLFPFTKEMQ